MWTRLPRHPKERAGVPRVRRPTRLAAISCQNVRRGAFSVFARLLGPDTKGKELVADLVVA